MKGLALSITFLISVAAIAQDDRMHRIEAMYPTLDSIYARQAAENHFPGLSYGLVVDGKLVHTFSMGESDLGAHIPVGTSTAFRIASMTKSFTAMAILRLRDEGKLKLDDPVSRYIPEMKGVKPLTKDAPEVTIRHLLMHGAGFPEDNPWGDRQMAKDDASMLAMIRKGISFSNDPGLAYEYSNMGFAMLGYIIRKASGMYYADYIKKYILLPLGMTHTELEIDRVPKKDLAHGYRWLDGKWVEQPMLHDGTYGAMGGMITTMEDFSRYAAFHLSAWPPSDAAETGPVKRSSVREMHFPWNNSSFNPNFKYASGRACPTVTAYCYGLGWLRDCEDRIMIGHSGGLPGFGSNWRILPAYGIGIISFFNLTYAPAATINLRALDTLIRTAGLTPRALPPSAILQQRRDELMRVLPDWEKAEASGIFAENFFLDYFPDALRREARPLFDQIGKVIKVHPVVPENNLRGYFIVEGEKGKLQVNFTLTPENPPLIQEYHIRLL